MMNQYTVDNPTFRVNECFSLLLQLPTECPAVLWECRAATTGRQVFGTRMVFSGNVFANPTASSSAPYPQESNPCVFNVSKHTSPHVMSESQTPVQDQRCQSRPFDRNSFDPSEGRFLKNYGADQQRLLISDPHYDKFPTPATFACWKIIQD